MIKPKIYSFYDAAVALALVAVMLLGAGGIFVLAYFITTFW